MTGIIGSGFGIYGYLPAVLLEDENVCLLEKTKDNFLRRTELAQLKSKILWIKNEELFLDQIDTIIISVPPLYQSEILNKSLYFSNIKNIIIEKPIAPSPDKSIRILNNLKRLNKNFRIGYSFLYTSWYESLSNQFENRKIDERYDLSIVWNFKAHHYKNDLVNWKRYCSNGGGVIRFYGIQLIAVLASLEFNEIVESQIIGQSNDDISYWKSNSKDIFGNTCHLLIDTNSAEEKFEIILQEKTKDMRMLCSLKENSPFDNQENISQGMDNRVSSLNKLYIDLKIKHLDEDKFNQYQSINHLWSSYENLSSFKHKRLN